MATQNEEQNNSNKIISVIIVTIFNYLILKSISDWLKEKGITKLQAFLWVIAISYALFFLAIVCVLVFKYFNIL